MNLAVKFYNVEHGSCTHIITPNGLHYLVDVGTKSTKSICQFLKHKYFENQGRIDYLIITHPHLDHIADLENLYKYNIAPRVLWRANEAFPLENNDTDSFAQISLKNKANMMNKEYSSQVEEAVMPSNPSYNGGVIIELFQPSVIGTEKNDLNMYSCVVVIKYAGFKIVLTGDNPAVKLDEMLQRSDFRQAIRGATVLLAPHHGRDSDFCEDFVREVNPLLSVLSDKAIQYDTQIYATQKYYSLSQGTTWDGTPRRVFTTRSDGTITFRFNHDQTWEINTSVDEY